MPEFDTIIKNGMLVDGTRAPRYRADIGIKNGRIASIGKLQASDARQVLDATGHIVAPGFIDPHTHYDAQVFWDPYCTISSWHGATTVAIGQCGFGFAPVKPDARERSMLMMSRNEAISMDAMRAGMPWDWETLPEFMDSLDRTPKGLNILPFVPLNPLMIYVMGLDEAKSGRPATEAETHKMQELLAEGMAAGFNGWSCQRMGENSMQADYDGTPMPTDVVSSDLLLAFAETLGELGEGAIQFGDPFTPPDEVQSFMEQLAEVSGRTVKFEAVMPGEQLDEKLVWMESCNRRGLRMIAQGFSVRACFIFSLNNFNMFDQSPAWGHALHGTVDEQIAKLSDPDVREKMKVEEELITMEAIGGKLENLLIVGVGSHEHLEKYVGMRLGEYAKLQGTSVLEALLDISISGKLEVVFRTNSVAPEDPKETAEMLRSPYVVPGASDGGAHSKFLTGGSYPTDMLAWLVRDTEEMSLEDAHWSLSWVPAQTMGIKNRGLLLEGWPADIVVYDLENLKRVPEWEPEIAFDLPGGDWRRIQRAEGYRYILVNGEVTFEDGKCTEAHPGQVLRNGVGAG
jgi:N-acyl-D-aspartate/D-glutamate deacylase